MRTHFYSAILASFIIILFNTDVHAVTKETANAVVTQFEKMPRPAQSANPFEKWTYDTTLNTVRSCWFKATDKYSVPKSLNVGETSAGTFTLPEENEIEKLCQSIAEDGINPVCTHSSLWVANFKRSGRWSLDYLQVPKDYSAIKVEGGLYCYLNSKQAQKQFYAANLSYEWTEKPSEKSIMTAQGAKTVRSGNVMLQDKFAKGLDGKPYKEPRIVIIQE